MRSPQLLWLLLCFMAFPLFLTIFSFSSTQAQGADTITDNHSASPSRFRALLSFRTPVSLFPPSAVISLTDDNSTFFLARPAAFGASLPHSGLSSQLWAGSGFPGEDNLRGSRSEGELGCSDVPGWGEGEDVPGTRKQPNLKQSKMLAADKAPSKDAVGGGTDNRKAKRAAGKENRGLIPGNNQAGSPSEGDGTDDHLHHPFAESNPAESATPGQPADHGPTYDKSKPPTHADIQSLQESAEIAGKVVLLSRGGCGFLEKVKWVQRRGGVALVVGDDSRGGPLITMYARGDTSNITIPSLFTSYTTAHLLSSLIPAKTQEEKLDGHRESNSKKSKHNSEKSNNGPTFTTKIAARPTDPPKSLSSKDIRSREKDIGAPRSLFTRFMSLFGLSNGARYQWHVAADSRRPPSSGNLDWVLLEDWDDGELNARSGISPATQRSSTGSGNEELSPDTSKTRPSDKSSDDFVIGVQDWRDPDLLESPDSLGMSKTNPSDLDAGGVSSKATGQTWPAANKPEDAEPLQGGSITPSSGEYIEPNSLGQGPQKPGSAGQAPYHASQRDYPNGNNDNGWIQSLRWSSSPDDAAMDPKNVPTKKSETMSSKDSNSGARPTNQDPSGIFQIAEEHDGLWVTLTPATMSTSPFFDTLLVLVVSPLVTLTLVYALLVLRSRIRRRRWRAPKSVVDRLPVRVYQTMSSSSSSSSSSFQTTALPASSPASPLLRSMSRPINTRNRPRSQTTSGFIPSLQDSTDQSSASSPPTKEKATPASIRGKPYTGRQIECCVCLEEYVDGQSRVMSLPCGHEFHADCITPWLVRRRRTCPICKGDVVKSMARGGPSERRQDSETRSDEIQPRAAETVNVTRSAAIPIPANLSMEDGEDLEQGSDPSTSLLGRSTSPRSAWRNLTSLNILALGDDSAVWRSGSSDRNR